MPETLGRLQGVVGVGIGKVLCEFVYKSTVSNSHVQLHASPEECVFVVPNLYLLPRETKNKHFMRNVLLFLFVYDRVSCSPD